MGDSVEKMTPEGVAASAVEVLKTAIEGFRGLREDAEALAGEGSSAERVTWDSVLKTLTAIEGMLLVDIMSLKKEKPDFTPDGFKRNLITSLDDHLKNIRMMNHQIEAIEPSLQPGEASIVRAMFQIALRDCLGTSDAIIEINNMPVNRAM